MAQFTQHRNVELLVSEVKVLGTCFSCREKEGVLVCSGCKAVSYCGEDCQQKGWKDHRKICNEIHQLLQEVEVAIQALAREFGGVEALLESPLVKDGLFRFLSSSNPRDQYNNNKWPTLSKKYDLARWKLINTYEKCGKEASSKLAFRLAAENLIHMLWLSRGSEINHYAFLENYHKYFGWMVAGEMDQQALNYIGYMQTDHPRTIPYFDLSDEEDIEGLSVINRVKEKVVPRMLVLFTPRFQVHDFMLISLIKYKRIKALSVLRKEEEERWDTFLEGTCSRDGDSSVVLMLCGMAPVLEKLKGLVVDKSIDDRIYSLVNQINGLLMEVNEENPKLIPGILDRHVRMVDNPRFPDTDGNKDVKEYNSHSGLGSFIPAVEKEVHIARFAVGKYGHACHIEKDYTRALRLFLETGFLETGNVTAEEEDTSSRDMPVAAPVPNLIPVKTNKPALVWSQDQTSLKINVTFDTTRELQLKQIYIRVDPGIISIQVSEPLKHPSGEEFILHSTGPLKLNSLVHTQGSRVKVEGRRLVLTLEKCRAYQWRKLTKQKLGWIKVDHDRQHSSDNDEESPAPEFMGDFLKRSQSMTR